MMDKNSPQRHREESSIVNRGTAFLFPFTIHDRRLTLFVSLLFIPAPDLLCDLARLAIFCGRDRWTMVNDGAPHANGLFGRFTLDR